MIVFESRASVVLYRLLRGRAPRAALLPSNVCTAVPLACMAAGVPFEFVDIDPATLEIDLERCARLVRQEPRKYGALVFVRPYGVVAERAAGFRRLREAGGPDLLVVDDRCLCRPDLEPVGDDGVDAVLYSTGPKKHVDLGIGGFGVLGDGVGYDAGAPAPAVAPPDAEVFDAVVAALRRGEPAGSPLHWPAAAPVGDLQAYLAEIARVLPAVDEAKRAINAVYRDAIPAEACLPEAYQPWRFNVVVEDPAGLVDRLFQAGLFASRHYRDLAPVLGRAACANASRVAGAIVNLFNDRYYSEEMAIRTAQVVRAHVQSRGVPSWAAAITGDPPHG